MSDSCVFCEIIRGRSPADVRWSTEHSWAFVPLGPVVEGHLLVVPRVHVVDASERPEITARVMADAAAWASASGRPFNLITSGGRAATQSVFHLHVHYVPRAEDDQLMVPWGTVYGDDPQAPHWCRVAQRLQDQLDDGPWAEPS